VLVQVLKKRCRDMDIRRWPHRKLKSMKVLIETVQQLSEKDNGSATRQVLSTNLCTFSGKKRKGAARKNLENVIATGSSNREQRHCLGVGYPCRLS
jgi:hypothetical protein